MTHDLNQRPHRRPDWRPDWRPDERLDQRLTRALETAPHVAIAAGFAARVAAQLPVQPARAVLPAIALPGVGRRVWLAALAILFVGVFALAIFAGSANQPARLTLEAVLAVEFILLTVYLTLRPHSLR